MNFGISGIPVPALVSTGACPGQLVHVEQWWCGVGVPGVVVWRGWCVPGYPTVVRVRVPPLHCIPTVASLIPPLWLYWHHCSPLWLHCLPTVAALSPPTVAALWSQWWLYCGPSGGNPGLSGGNPGLSGGFPARLGLSLWRFSRSMDCCSLRLRVRHFSKTPNRSELT